MPESSSRRDFVRSLALASPAAAFACPALGDEPTKKPVDPPILSEVDARMELILARFGTKLDAESRKLVRAEVEAIVRKVELLRKVPLTNGDGPFPVFTPFRSPLG